MMISKFQNEKKNLIIPIHFDSSSFVMSNTYTHTHRHICFDSHHQQNKVDQFYVNKCFRSIKFFFLKNLKFFFSFSIQKEKFYHQ